MTYMHSLWGHYTALNTHALPYSITNWTLYVRLLPIQPINCRDKAPTRTNRQERVKAHLGYVHTGKGVQVRVLWPEIYLRQPREPIRLYHAPRKWATQNIIKGTREKGSAGNHLFPRCPALTSHMAAFCPLFFPFTNQKSFL